MTDNHGFGVEKRKQGNKDTLDGTLTFRDSFQQMLDSWTTSMPETISILKKNIKVDPHFSAFMDWASANSVPVIVLSSGMVPVIRAMLDELLEAKDIAAKIEIVANEAKPIPPHNSLDKAGGWSIQYHDDSGFGHDKSLTIRPYADAIAKMPKGQHRPTLLYAGDGVSDLSAARETGKREIKEPRAKHPHMSHSTDTDRRPPVRKGRPRPDHLLRKGEHPLHRVPRLELDT